MSIRFLLDENIPFALIEFLEKKGYRVDHLKKMGKGGIKNGEVYKIAEENKMWIVTRDADFQSYYKFALYDVSGIIVLKLTSSKTNILIKTIDSFLKDHRDRLNEKHLIIIEDEVVKLY